MEDKDWTAEDWGDYGNTGVIYGGDGDRVAVVEGNLALGVSGEDRAKRIVQAVNLHDDLVHTLERLIDELPTKRDWLDPALESFAWGILAKAKGA